jgi:tetratricopeptide (TPR) repeat protein
LLEKIPLLVLSAASAWITLVAQRPAERTFEEFPLGVRIENAVVAYGMYLWKMLWPARLAKYPHPGDTLAVWPIIASALILVGVTALVVVFRRKRYLPVGWFWFLGTLVPVIGLVQVGDAAMADRYAYVPLIGIFVMIAWGAADLAEAKRVRAAWLVITALCVLTALGFVTHRQMSYWDSEFNLWSHTLAATDPEQSAFAHDALGSALLAPETTMTPQSLENFDSQEKRLGEARRHMERALELRRELAKRQRSIFLLGMATTLNNLGNLDRLENRTGEARQHYEEALQIHSQLSQQNHDPYSEHIATMLNNLGALEKDSKRADEAYQHFEGALGIYRHLAQQYPDTYLPKVAETLNNLGFVEREQRRMDEARRDYEEALKIRRQLAQQDPDAYVPYLATTLNDLGILDGVQHRMDDARRHYEEALQTYRQLAKKDPDTYRRYVAATLNNLAFLDELQNRIEEARIHYHEALKIYRELYESDPNSYGGDVARVDLRLEQLDKKGPSQ